MGAVDVRPGDEVSVAWGVRPERGVVVEVLELGGHSSRGGEAGGIGPTGGRGARDRRVAAVAGPPGHRRPGQRRSSGIADRAGAIVSNTSLAPGLYMWTPSHR